MNQNKKEEKFDEEADEAENGEDVDAEKEEKTWGKEEVEEGVPVLILGSVVPFLRAGLEFGLFDVAHA